MPTSDTFKVLLRRPSAFAPLALSLIALALVVCTVGLFGVPDQPSDEGTAAHLWQILMVGQLPFLAFFAIKWLPRSPKFAILVLALQIGAALAAMAPVFLLHL